MPRKGGPTERRSIANVEKVLVVASGKGGVGKSTIAGEYTPKSRTATTGLYNQKFTSQPCVCTRITQE